MPPQPEKRDLLSAIFLLLLSLFLLGYSLRESYDSQASAFWPTTEGIVTISATGQEYNRRNESYRYWPEATFTYQVAGRSFTGSALAFGGPLSTADSSEASSLSRQFDQGTTVTVYYHPSDPARATLLPNHYGYYIMLSFIFGIGSLSFGSLLLYKYLRMNNELSLYEERQAMPKIAPPSKRSLSRRERKLHKQAQRE